MIDIEDQIEYFYGFFKFERTMKESIIFGNCKIRNIVNENFNI